MSSMSLSSESKTSRPSGGGCHYVLKRSGRREEVQFDKVTARIQKLCYGLDPIVDPIAIAQKVCAGIYPGVRTSELDELASQKAASLSCQHPDYGLLAGRICTSNLQKSTSKDFLEVCTRLVEHRKHGRDAPLLIPNVYAFIKENIDAIQAALIYDRDMNLDYFAIRTLMEQKYLTAIDSKIVERPAHLWMRVAASLWVGDLERTLETYEVLSQQMVMHATPTLFNAGKVNQSMSSCFLIQTKADSIEGIFSTIKDAALISKAAGGLGIAVTHIRAKGSYIHGTDGTSQGLLPLFRVLNNVARYVDQCFGPRTIVYTAMGPKFIKDVTISDQLLSATGTFNQVEKLLRHDFSGSILQIEVIHGLSPVEVTREHQILAVKRNNESSVDRFRTHIQYGKRWAEMTDAKELEVGDWLCFPIPKLETVHDIPTLGMNDARFYGLLVRSGWIHNDDTSGVVVKPNEFEFVRTYCAVQGLQVRETFCGEETDAEVRFEWKTNSVGFLFNRNQLYDLDGGKIIDPSFLNLPNYKLHAILQGIAGASSSLVEFRFVTIPQNAQVIQSLRYMLIRCEILTSAADTPDTGYLIHDGMMYTPIEKISTAEYSGTLYDFEVATEHTYVTSIGACHNGGGKRKGAIALYLEPWHLDTEEVLPHKENKGQEEFRARDIFLAMWIPDIFMERCAEDGPWSYFCPSDVPDLLTLTGPAFTRRYIEYEKEGKARKVVKARALNELILRQKVSTGTPYILFKDHCNLKSNHQHLGVIQCSNLCCEIVEWTAPDEIAVCNLASICLSKCVTLRPGGGGEMFFDHNLLFKLTKLVTRNLNRIIDLNDYPVPASRKSNLRHRSIGIGVQGLADAFLKLRLVFDSTEARQLNKEIFETMYFAAMTQSMELARKEGVYESYPGSPLSQGMFQFDLWKIQPSKTSRWDWNALKRDVAEFGCRNSLLLAPMPTATTSQISMNNEAIEPYTSNMFVRKTTSGEFICINRWLVNHLQSLGLWSTLIQEKILAHKGSIQTILEIPESVRDLYRTVYEINPESLIEMSADRGPFICQSQSLNLWLEKPNVSDVNRLVFLAWRLGLKTGIYYLRTPPGADPLAVTLSADFVAQESTKRRLVPLPGAPPHPKLPPPPPLSSSSVPLILRGNSCDDACTMCHG